MRRASCLLLSLLASPALAELTVSSTADGFKAVLLDSLPTAPANGSVPGFCSLVLDDPVTPAGQTVQALGWQITAELPFGTLTAVSFAGRVTPATSGTCELLDGNVGLFDGDRLVALIYGTSLDEPLIGQIRPFGSDALRILSGDILPGSMADIRLEGETLTVTAPAAEEPVCGGQAIIARIEGLPIDEARQNLVASGWSPVQGLSEDRSLGWARELAGMGLPELQECSGTGFGFCLFSYDHPAARLNVVTAGELGEDGSLPAVVRSWAECRSEG
ncbi:MAG: hypothetical protein MUE52_16950 [Tabrizicola sp.]|jgi:hypothetical protein|nr:hypothetical protein [Tabrizicola sp.]